MSSLEAHTRETLRELPRKAIQDLAKKNGVKANNKTEQIIDDLLRQKVDPTGAAGAGTTTGKTIPIRVKKRAVIKVEALDDVDRTAKRRRVSGGPFPQEDTPYIDSSDPEPDDELPVPNANDTRNNANPTPAAPIAPNPPNPPLSPIAKRGPSLKDVRSVKRGVTRLVNEKPEVEQKVKSTGHMLEHVKKILADGEAAVAKLSWVTYSIEISVLERMKDDRTVWDGTGFLPKGPQKKWRRLVKKYRRKEHKRRKAQAEDSDEDIETARDAEDGEDAQEQVVDEPFDEDDMYI